MIRSSAPQRFSVGLVAMKLEFAFTKQGPHEHAVWLSRGQFLRGASVNGRFTGHSKLSTLLCLEFWNSYFYKWSTPHHDVWTYRDNRHQNALKLEALARLDCALSALVFNN